MMRRKINFNIKHKKTRQEISLNTEMKSKVEQIPKANIDTKKME